MATPFVRQNGTVPKTEYGTALGGICTVQPTNSTVDYTHTLPPDSSVLTGKIFVQVADQVISNTTTETTQFGTGTTGSSRIIDPNTAVVGATYHIRLNGYISNTGTPNATIRIKIGGVTLVTSGPVALPSGLTNAFVETIFTFTVRSVGATGTVRGQGHTKLVSGALGTTYNRQLTMTSDATIDFTTGNEIDITYEWGTASASNTLTITNASIGVW